MCLHFYKIFFPTTIIYHAINKILRYRWQVENFRRGHFQLYSQPCRSQVGSVSIYRCGLTSIEIPSINIRRSHDRLIFIIQISIPGKTFFILGQGPDDHDDIVKCKHFPRSWPFERGNHRSPVNSPHKNQLRGASIFFYRRLNKRLSKQSWGWWFQTPSRSLWRHRNAMHW